MTNNITAQPGTETPIPCRALVSVLGWAMELQQLRGMHEWQETNKLLFETFIVSENGYEKVEREEALMFYNEINDLCNILSSLSKEEIKRLNEFLLSVCEEQMKIAAA